MLARGMGNHGGLPCRFVAHRSRRAPPRGTLRAMNWQCPICRKPTASETHPDFPFCSERCRLLDLGNWAAERYVVSEPVVDESAPEKPEPDEPHN